MWSIRLSLVRACVCCVARVCGSSTRICSRCITRMVCGWCPVSCFRALMCCVCSPHPERNGRGRDVTGGQTESASGESAARKWLQARWHAGWKMERRETTRDSREWKDGGDRRGRCRGVKINYYAAPVGWRARANFFFARPARIGRVSSVHRLAVSVSLSEHLKSSRLVTSLTAASMTDTRRSSIADAPITLQLISHLV